MTCQEARDGLWPPERPRLAGAAVVEARAHVEGCAACRTFFAQDRALLDAFHRLRRGRCPDDVRARVMGSLDTGAAGSADVPVTSSAVAGRAAPPTGRKRWVRPPALSAAALTFLLGAAAAALFVRGPAPEEPPHAFVHDYLRRTVGQEFLIASDPAEVRRFVARELGIFFEPLVLPGFTLERAEICLLGGHRGVVVVYGDGSASVSHYLVPSDAARRRAPRLSDGEALAGARMPVATWSTEGLDQALVGDVDAESLLWLARVGSGF